MRIFIAAGYEQNTHFFRFEHRGVFILDQAFPTNMRAATFNVNTKFEDDIFIFAAKRTFTIDIRTC